MSLSSIILLYVLWKYYGGSLYWVLGYVNEVFPVSSSPWYGTNLPWCGMLRKYCTVIRNEYIQYVTHYDPPAFGDVDEIQKKLSLGPNEWKVVILRLYGRDSINMRLFPKTQKLLEYVPGCTLAMFSILEPWQSIRPHNGPYSGVLRYHLTLIAPKEPLKCHIHITDSKNRTRKYAWKEGHDVMFDDTFRHWVDNNTQDTRVVLFLDIKREFESIFLNALNTICLGLFRIDDHVKTIVEKVNAS